MKLICKFEFENSKYELGWTDNDIFSLIIASSSDKIQAEKNCQNDFESFIQQDMIPIRETGYSLDTKCHCIGGSENGN